MSTVACDANVNIKLLPLDTLQSEPSPAVTGDQRDAAAPDTASPSTELTNTAPSNTAPSNGPQPDADAASASATGSSPVIPASGAPPDAGSDLVLPAHHYDFAGDGTGVPDLVGGADATLVGGGKLTLEGEARLDGVDDYVDLPNGILSSLQSATITLLLTWHGGACWQRLLDFGSSSTEEGTASAARTSLFVTPASCSGSHLGPVEPNVLSLMFHAPGNYTLAQDENPLPADTPTFVTLSADVDGTLRFTIDGRTVIETGGALRLADLNDINNWIGRSQWEQDSTLNATLFDLRIYDVALTVEQIDRLYRELWTELDATATAE